VLQTQSAAAHSHTAGRRNAVLVTGCLPC
jgi:hypothetical protein